MKETEIQNITNINTKLMYPLKTVLTDKFLEKQVWSVSAGNQKPTPWAGPEQPKQHPGGTAPELNAESKM